MPTPQSGTSEILDVLLEAGQINEEQYRLIETEHAKTGKTVETLLLERRVVDEELLTKARGTVLGMPYGDLVGKDIPGTVMNLIPRAAAETNQAIAFERDGEEIHVGLVDPRDPSAMQAIDFLGQTQNLHFKFFIISNASFAAALKKYEAIGKEVAKALEVAKEKYVEDRKAPEVEGKLEDVIKGAPVSRIVSVVIRHAVEQNASDIHIEPFGDETRIRYRLDGILKTTLTLPKYIHGSIIARIKVLAGLKLDETRIPQDGRISETIGGKVIDFRVSTMPLAEFEKVVMRVLDTTKGVPTLEQLGFRKEYIRIIQQEIRKPHGLFLITGPTGSGKSTTLFTVLNMRNEEGVNIATLEDPVEYYIKGVNQAQIRPEVGFTFAAGLRALLRQDPNIIMVGEIRDGETGELSVHAALTGHLIFSTLHTNDAFGIVPRLVDMKVEPFLLSATINLAIAQRLARKICDRCKTKVSVPPEIEAQFRKDIESMPAVYLQDFDLTKTLEFSRGMGCMRCNNTGYVGRISVAELIIYDETMRQLIVEGFPIDKVRVAATDQKMITLKQDGLLKVLEGITTIEEVLRITAE